MNKANTTNPSLQYRIRFLTTQKEVSLQWIRPQNYFCVERQAEVLNLPKQQGKTFMSNKTEEVTGKVFKWYEFKEKNKNKVLF